MVLEVIKKVREAEEQAEQLLAQAQKDAVKMVKDANTEGEQKYEAMISAAKAEGNQRMLDTLAMAEEEVAKIAEKGKQQQETAMEHSKEQINNAINLVIERIVDRNGNR